MPLKDGFEHLTAICLLTLYTRALEKGSREAGEAERVVSGLHYSLIRLPLKVRTAALHVLVSWSSGNGLVIAPQMVVLPARQSSAVTVNIL